MISFQGVPKDPETAIVIYLRLKSKDFIIYLVAVFEYFSEKKFERQYLIG
jgi:hypothetical protein